MKTAPEWLKQGRWSSLEMSVESIAQIQQDAWKQGMIDAIESIRNSDTYAGEYWHIKTIEDAIQKGFKE